MFSVDNPWGPSPSSKNQGAGQGSEHLPPGLPNIDELVGLFMLESLSRIFDNYFQAKQD
jgi:hypothetical protein